MKKILLLLLCVLGAMTLVGCCELKNEFVIKKNGKVTVTEKQAYAKEAIDRLNKTSKNKKSMKGFKVTKINGKEFYVNEVTKETTIKKYNKTDRESLLDTDKAVFLVNSKEMNNITKEVDETSELSAVDIKFSVEVTFEDNIVETNGKIDEDKPNKVEFKYDKEKDKGDVVWYAYTSTNHNLEADKAKLIKKSDRQIPTIKGVKTGKTYKNKAVFYVKDNIGIKSIKLNKKKVSLKNTKLIKSGKRKGYRRVRSKTGRKRQSIVVTVKDYNGNTSSKFFSMKGTKRFIKKVKKALVVY